LMLLHQSRCGRAKQIARKVGWSSRFVARLQQRTSTTLCITM
jgi:hypothetical protein